MNESKTSSELEAIYETGHYRGSDGWLRLHSKLQQHLQPKGAAGAIFNGKISKADAEAADTTTPSSTQSDAEREMEEGLRALRRLSTATATRPSGVRSPLRPTRAHTTAEDATLHDTAGVEDEQDADSDDDTEGKEGALDDPFAGEDKLMEIYTKIKTAQQNMGPRRSPMVTADLRSLSVKQVRDLAITIRQRDDFVSLTRAVRMRIWKYAMGQIWDMLTKVLGHEHRALTTQVTNGDGLQLWQYLCQRQY